MLFNGYFVFIVIVSSRVLVQWISKAAFYYSRVSETDGTLLCNELIIIFFVKLTGYCPIRCSVRNPPWDPPVTTTLSGSTNPLSTTCLTACYDSSYMVVKLPMTVFFLF